MRLPRVRFTVRRMMVAVAIFGASLWYCEMGRRSKNFLAMADFHRLKAEIFRGRVESAAELTSIDPIRMGDIMGRDRRLEHHHSELGQKYEHAAHYPWLPVEPDPPEPR